MSEREKEPTSPSFVVSDRRHFTSAGERRPEVPDEPSLVTPVIETGKAASGQAPQREAARPAAGPQPLKPPPQTAPAEPKPQAAPAAAEPEEGISFAAFLEDLYIGAMAQLGAAPPGAVARPEPDLQGARASIEILQLLQRKTQGNLTAEENQLFQEILYELRVAYVSVVQRMKAAATPPPPGPQRIRS